MQNAEGLPGHFAFPVLHFAFSTPGERDDCSPPWGVAPIGDRGLPIVDQPASPGLRKSWGVWMVIESGVMEMVDCPTVMVVA